MKNKVALILYSGFALSLPVSISGTQFFLAIGLIAWIIFLTTNKDAKHYFKSPYLPIFIVFLLLPLLSLINAENVAWGLKYIKRHFYVLSIPLVASTYHLVKNRTKLLLNIYIFSSSVNACYAILQIFFGEHLEKPFHLATYYVHAAGFFSNPLTLAEVLPWSLLLTVLMFKATPSPKLKTVYGLSTLFIFWAIIFTRSRTATAISVFMLIVFIIYFFRKKGTPVIILILLTLISLPLINQRILWRFQMPGAIQNNVRLMLWENALKSYKEHILIGNGIGHFYNYLDKNVKEKDRWILKFNHAHNNILEVAATTGTMGLLGFFLFWGLISKDLFTASRKTLNSNDHFFYVFIFINFIIFHINGLTECNIKDAEVFFQLYFFLGIFYSYYKAPDFQTEKIVL